MSITAANVPSLSPGSIDWRSMPGLLVHCANERRGRVKAARRSDTLDSVQNDAQNIDADDLRAVHAGDGRAYERIVRRHQQAIARKLRRFTRDDGTLEELVHETFVEAYFSLGSYRGNAPLEHWLHRIAVRVGYRFWKSRKSALATTSLEEPVAAMSQPPTISDDREVLEQVLSHLSPRDRLVITLLYLDEHSVAETASLAGWSKAMVKVQAFRARARLRKLLNERGVR